MKAPVIAIAAVFIFLSKPAFPQEQISKDSPFGANDFGIPAQVARVIGIASKEQMAMAIEADKIPYFKALGIKWARLHPNIFGTFGLSGVDPMYNGRDLDFSKQDELVRIAQENNINLLAGISPTPTDAEWLSMETFIPEDKDAYTSYVRKLVERYDGDGIDDMPGLKQPVKYWQLENEPDLHNKVRGQRGNAKFCSPEEYFEVLKLTFEAAKEADKDAMIVLNAVGIGQGMGDTSINYLQRLNELGAKKYYDIFSYHVYPGTYNTYALKEFLQRVKAFIAGKPVWITESGISSRYRGLENVSEINQAAWVIKHHVFHAASGVKRIFWLTFTDMSLNVPEGQIAKYAGLLTFSSRTRKLAYYTYKKMVEALEGSDWNNIQAVEEKDGIYIYKFIKQGRPIWVAWNDNKEPQEITVSGISSIQVKITKAIPVYEHGAEVVDYGSAFETGVRPAQNERITIVLGQSPVFIEESGPAFSQQQNGRYGGTPKMYVSFVVNINDWIDHDLSAETLSRLIDIYDKYNVKADLYFTEPVLKAYEKYHPELIWKIKKSGMSIGYHFRPPHPAYDMFKGILRSKENLVKSGNDCRAVKSLSYAEKVRILSDFESYALKTDDWPPEGWPDNQDGYCSSFDKGETGGYKYVASVFEVSPVISGISNIIDEELRKAEAEVLKKMGTKIFVTEHFGNSRDNPDNAFEEKYGLLTRPSDIGLSFFEGPLTETSAPSMAAQRLLEQAKRINFDRSMFGVLAVHDHDFNKIMGWDMSKRLGSKILRPQADREKLFKEYEEVVRLVVEDKNVMPVSADQIYGFYQKTKDNSQLSQGEISGGNPFAAVFIVHCETGRNVHTGSRLESYLPLEWEEKH